MLLENLKEENKMCEIEGLDENIKDFELINGDKLKTIILIGETQGIRRIEVSE